MLLSIRNVNFVIKMLLFTIFITAVCVLFLIKLLWPKNKSLYCPIVLDHCGLDTLKKLPTKSTKQPPLYLLTALLFGQEVNFI